MSTVVIIQVVLITLVVLVVARLFRSRGARAQAIRRIGLVVFAAFAAVSILFPDMWTKIAQKVGVGPGADLVLYAPGVGRVMESNPSGKIELVGPLGGR